MSSNIHNETVSAAKAMLAIVAIVFVAEFMLMALLAVLGFSMREFSAVLLDASLLARHRGAADLLAGVDPAAA